MSFFDRFAFGILRVVRSSRLEPVEGVLSFSAALHGFIFFTDLWGAADVFSGTPSFSRMAVSVLSGLLLMFSGVATVASSYGRCGRFRLPSLLAQFAGWSGILVAVIFNPIFGVPVMLTYSTIVVLSAMVYLSACQGGDAGE